MPARPAAHTPFSRQIRDRLGDKWTVPIVDALSGGPLRFGELWRQVGAAPKVLTSVLRSLERDGLVERSESRDPGLQVEYRLSPTGRAFHGLVNDIELWAVRHEPRIAAARRDYAPPASRSAPADAAAAPAGLGLTLSHICIPVHDIDQAIRGFAAVLGVDPTSVRETATVLQPGRGRERIRICWFAFPNLLVELIQQMRGSGPFNDFLDRTGLGVAHVGIDVHPDWRVSPRLRDRLGLKLTERPDGLIHRADIDYSRELGTDIHLLAPTLRQTAERWLPASPATTSLAARPVSHIGIVVPSVMQADRACSKLRRLIDPSAPRPRAFRYRYTEDAMIATCTDGPIAVDLVQPLRGPLRDYLIEHGPGVHHIGFNVGTQVADTLEHLERKGPEAVTGGAGDGRVRLDFSRNLGLQIDLTNAVHAAAP